MRCTKCDIAVAKRTLSHRGRNMRRSRRRRMDLGWRSVFGQALSRESNCSVKIAVSKVDRMAG